MKPVSVSLRRLRSLFRRSALDRAMDDEMHFHLEEQTRENLAGGMSPREARRAAAIAFGGAERFKVEAREQRWLAWLDAALADARYAARALRKNPGFTATAALTLALGLGVNTALFTWFNAIAFRPVPVQEPQQLFRLNQLDEQGRLSGTFSHLDYVAYRDRNTAFSELFAWAQARATLSGWSGGAAADDPTSEEISLQHVSTNYFQALGVRTVLGRPFAVEDDSAAVIVLSHPFWQRHFGGAPDVIGKTLRVEGLSSETLTVAGVAAPEFAGPTPLAPAGWIPLSLRPGETWRTRPDDRRFSIVGRLRPGISREQAEAEMLVIAHQIAGASPAHERQSGSITLTSVATYVSLSPDVIADLAPLFVAFGAVLVIACANVSNLVLARVVTRQAEFGVRRALGATRQRLFSQLLIENLLLGSVGGVAGWIVSEAAMRVALPRLLGMMTPFAPEGWTGLNVAADYRVFVFSLLCSVAAGAIGGFLPALHASRHDVVSALKNEGSFFGRRLQPTRVRSFLAAAQLALGTALLFTAGLLVHKTLRVQFLDVGFDKARLTTLEVLTPRTSTEVQVANARREVLERVRHAPGVLAAVEASRLPFGRPHMDKITAPANDARGEMRLDVDVHPVAPGYFETMQLPIVRGRKLFAEEVAGDFAAIVSESTAKELWPDEDPIGQRLERPAERDRSRASSSGGISQASVPLTVVGVARDTRETDLQFGDGPKIYVPFRDTRTPAYIIIRTSVPAAAMTPTVGRIAAEVTGIGAYVRTADDLFSKTTVIARVMAWLAGALAALALLLAIVGLYGVMSFAVNQRVREIGVRIALGATPGRVATGILVQSLRLVAVGGAAGFLLGAALTRIARGLIQITAFDPLACVLVALLLGAFGLLASWLPARRAARVDPMIALRAE